MSAILSSRKAALRAPLILISSLALMGCVDGKLNLPFGLGSGRDAAETSTTGSVAPAGEGQDVEAPEIFSITEQGLWDGRPSLGGVWVAYPDVADPERVIIRNDANGTFVIGALFRRERDNPGPALQISSDAAEELGLLAGSPATLTVIALRREESTATPPIADPSSDFDTGETVTPSAPVDVTAAPLDPVTTGPLDASSTPLTVPQPTVPTTTDPLEAASAAIDRSEQPAAAAPPATTPTPAPNPQLSGGLERPFIQLGIFSLEANANSVATQMRNAGLPVTVLAQNSQGRDFWRVIVGPASNETARSSALDQVKSLGFTDAYFVTN